MELRNKINQAFNTHTTLRNLFSVVFGLLMGFVGSSIASPDPSFNRPDCERKFEDD